jgi:hypothetical protein
MSASRNGRVDASLFGISDSEILGILDDLADENGWTSTYAVRVQLGEKMDQSDRKSGVGPRLAWLRRYGWIERGERERIEQTDGTWVWTQRWRLTAMGNALLDNPDLSKTVENALSKLNPAQRLRLTRELGDAGSATAPEIRNALRRQWQRSMRVR